MNHLIEVIKLFGTVAITAFKIVLNPMLNEEGGHKYKSGGFE